MWFMVFGAPRWNDTTALPALAASVRDFEGLTMPCTPPPDFPLEVLRAPMQDPAYSSITKRMPARAKYTRTLAAARLVALVEQRRAAGETDRAIAADLGMDASILSKLRTEPFRNVRPATLEQVISRLGIDPQYFTEPSLGAEPDHRKWLTSGAQAASSRTGLLIREPIATSPPAAQPSFPAAAGPTSPTHAPCCCGAHAVAREWEIEEEQWLLLLRPTASELLAWQKHIRRHRYPHPRVDATIARAFIVGMRVGRAEALRQSGAVPDEL
jgi:hypothetical protein